MRYSESLVDLIGNTPLVRLRSVTDHLPADRAPLILAKVEYFNPGGSVKDRIAVRMIDAAERSGQLRPGGTIVEPTSGNTGVGLAIVAQQRGYHCIFVCPDKVSGDKINTLRAFGAEVVVCPTAVSPEDERSYYSVSDRLAHDTPGGWKPDQYSNQSNPLSHYETTGPELWEQTDGRITHFVAGVGTGGTISGVGRYLKEVSGGRVQIIGADPEGSVYSGGTGRPYLVEGVGEDFWPDTFDKSICDEIVAVSDARSFQITRRLAREEGLLVGGSCGMAVAAALVVAERLTPEDVLVVLLPDGGRGYLSKIFSDTWMSDYGFIDTASEVTVGQVLSGKGDGAPQLIHAHPNETVREAIDILREYGVSQMPVVKAEPPVTAGEVVGSVEERALMDALFAGRASLADPVEPHMSAPLPIIGSGEPVSAAVALLESADALLVHIDGKPAGIITRQDVLGHLTPVKAVLFDLDMTLVDHVSAVHAALSAWLPERGVTAGPDRSALWLELEELHFPFAASGEITVGEHRRRRARDFFTTLGVPLAEDDLDAAFAGYLVHYERSWVAFDDALSTLRGIVAAGVRTAVVTNGMLDQQRRKVAVTGLADVCGPVFASDDLGLAKPDPAMFAEVCRRLGVAPHDATMVGDNYDLDVLGARAAGLRGIHLDRGGTHRVDDPDRVTTLADLTY